MAAPSITNTFTSNTTALASEMNANFADILAGLSSGSTWDVVVSTLTTGTASLNGAVTINESGADVDFRVEAFGVANALFVQGSDGAVGIGTATPSALFEIQQSSDSITGALLLQGATTGNGGLFIDSAGLLNLRQGGQNAIQLDSGVVYMPSLASGAGTYALKWTTSTGQLTYDTSSDRYKDNIRDSQYGLSTVLSLVSRQFEYKDTGLSDVGFVAEEVVNVIPELVPIDSEGRPDAVNYDRITSVLVKAIQELKEIVDAQAVEIAALKAK
jgi:hypothetical protein